MALQTDSRTTVERTSDRELVVTRLFDAPPRLVFRAWADPALFARWWVPKSAPIQLLACEMEIGAYAWVCARASVAPGVNVGEGAVLGLGSVATRDLEPWCVYAGVPAVKVMERKRR